MADIVKGYFIWPADEINPFDVFGRNLEALDPIRMYEECFILYRSQRSVFVVMSDFRDSVDHVIRRLRCLLCEVVSRSRRPFRRIMLEQMAIQDLWQYVHFEAPLSTSKMTADVFKENFVTCQWAGPQLTLTETEEYKHKLRNYDIMGISKLPRSLDRVLNGLRYFRGFIRMRIHFGIFGLTEYKKPIGEDHTLEQFFEMMQHPRTKGELRTKYAQSYSFCFCLTDRT